MGLILTNQYQKASGEDLISYEILIRRLILVTGHCLLVRATCPGHGQINLPAPINDPYNMNPGIYGNSIMFHR